MADFFAIAALAIFFALTLGLIALCERLIEQTP